MPQLKSIGIDTMWIPPGCKAATPVGNGYDIYDLYDLGEFDQKSQTRTKWGSKRELVDMIDTANSHGIGILWDAVLNHKAARTSGCSKSTSENILTLFSLDEGPGTIAFGDKQIIVVP